MIFINFIQTNFLFYFIFLANYEGIPSKKWKKWKKTPDKNLKNSV